MLGPGPTAPVVGSGFAGGGSPSGYARDIIWVDLRQDPGGNGTEGDPFNTANAGLGAVPSGGTLMLAGGSASGESGVTLNGKSLNVVGLGGHGGALAPVLPTLTYAITTGSQQLDFRSVSVSLVHSGTVASLSEFHFEFCPSVTLTAGGDASPVYCVGDGSCTFSGSGGAARFQGITLDGYSANGSGTVEIRSCDVTDDISSPVAITIYGASTFDAVSITAPSIVIDPVSHHNAVAAGVSFSTTPTYPVEWDAPEDIGTAASTGTALGFSHPDHVHRLTFTTLAAVLALATSAININGQRITGSGPPSAGSDLTTKDYVDSIATGFHPIAPVDTIATANQATQSGLAQVINGVALNTIGMRVLLTAQSTGSQNGVKVIQSGAWTRPTDFPTGGSAAGTSVLVLSAVGYENSTWYNSNATGSDVIDTNALTWIQTGGAFSVSAGNGLTKSGTTLHVGANADGSILVHADDIQIGVLATDAQHGNRGGGTLHDVATTSVAGFLSAADKTKLDGLPSSAVPTTRTVTAGAGLTGGGALSGDITLDVVAADSTITVAANSVAVGTISNSNITNNTLALAKLANAAAQFDILGRKTAASGAWEDCTPAQLQLATYARTLTAGAGLTGGGDLSADRTFDVVAADATITVNANSIQVGVLAAGNFVDNTVSLARLANATGQNHFLMRKTAGAGAWEDGTQAQALTGLGIAIGSSGTFSYSNGTSLGNTTSFTTNGGGLSGLTHVVINPAASAPTPPVAIDVTTASYTGLTGSIRVLNFQTTGTFSHVAGSYTTTSLMRIRQATIAGDSATAAFSGVTAALAIQGAPTQGTNATLANSVALWLENGDALAYGGAPATTGQTRYSNLHTVYVRGTSANIRVLEMGDNLSVGDGTSTGNGQLYLDVKTGGTHHIRVANSDEYTLDSVAFTMNGNNLVGAGFVSIGSTPAQTGAGRLSGNSSIKWRNLSGTPNTLDVSGLTVDSADNAILGDNTNAAATYIDCKTGGSSNVRVGSNVYTFDGAALTTNNKNLVLGTGVVTFGTTPSTNASVNFSSANSVLVGAKNLSGTNRALLTWVNTDVFVIGNASVGSLVTAAGGSWQFGSSASFPGVGHNIASGGHLSFGSTPAGGGLLRTPTNPGDILKAVNYDSSGDQSIIAVSGNTSFSDLQFSDGGAKGISSVYYSAKLQHVFNIGASAELALSGTALDIKDNVVLSGADPAGGGIFRMSFASGGSTWLAFKHGSSGAAVSVLAQKALSNDIVLGDPANAPGAYTRITSTNVLLDPDNASSGYAFNNGSANYHANALYFEGGGSTRFYADDNSTTIGKIANGSTSGLDLAFDAANNYVFRVGSIGSGTQRAKLSSTVFLLSTDLSFSGVGGNNINGAKYIEYRDSAAPSSPTDGWRVWSDSGTLKAKNSAGTVRTLAVP